MAYKTYKDALIDNKKALRCKLVKSIDNKTMQVRYSFYTNLHIDFGIVDELLHAGTFTKKSLANKRMQLIKAATNKKLKLVKTDNDNQYTRLIYEF